VELLVDEARHEVDSYRKKQETLQAERDAAVTAAKALDADYTSKFNTQRSKLQEFRERARKSDQ